ncbi:unnamed protein product, partial [Rotaria sordida]
MTSNGDDDIKSMFVYTRTHLDEFRTETANQLEKTLSIQDNVSTVESLIVNDKNKLIELNKKLDQEIISFGYLKESIEKLQYLSNHQNQQELCHVYFDLIKIKTRTRSSGFDKMRQSYKAFLPFNKDHKNIHDCSIRIRYEN